MASIRIKNNYTDASVEYSITNASSGYVAITGDWITVTGSIWIRTYTGSTYDRTYQPFILGFNMQNPSNDSYYTDKGASVDIDFQSLSNPYCQLSNFGNNNHYFATIGARPTQ